jgi:hypothetical protein
LWKKTTGSNRSDSALYRPNLQTPWNKQAFWTMMSGKEASSCQELTVAANPPEPVQPGLPPGPVYPGGETAPGYRLAFQAWMIFFLLTVCVGLLNFLGAKLKGIW